MIWQVVSRLGDATHLLDSVLSKKSTLSRAKTMEAKKHSWKERGGLKDPSSRSLIFLEKNPGEPERGDPSAERGK